MIIKSISRVKLNTKLQITADEMRVASSTMPDIYFESTYLFSLKLNSTASQLWVNDLLFSKQ